MTILPPGWPPLPPGSPPPVAERKVYIRGLMLKDLWERGESSRVLGVLWGLDPNTVTNNATAVSHVIRAGLDELDAGELRAKCVNQLDRASELAELGAQKDPLGAGKLLVAVAKGIGDVTGCAAPRRRQVEVSAGKALDWLTEGEDE